MNKNIPFFFLWLSHYLTLGRERGGGLKRWLPFEIDISHHFPHVTFFSANLAVPKSDSSRQGVVVQDPNTRKLRKVDQEFKAS